jgi:hypothetical protein
MTKGVKLPQFVPILNAFTERVAGCQMVELLRSPTALARALADTQAVIGHDGVLCGFDPLLLSSACALHQAGSTQPTDIEAVLKSPEEVLSTEPMTTILESIQPLRHQLPEYASIFITFSGPELLYSRLHDTLSPGESSSGVDPDYVIDVILNVVRSSLDLKADGIAFIERTVSTTPPELLRIYKKVRKLTDFYDAGFLVFRLPDSETQDAHSLAHCIFNLPQQGNGIGPVTAQPGASMVLNNLPFTTAGDVPEDTAIESLKELLHTG